MTELIGMLLLIYVTSVSVSIELPTPEPGIQIKESYGNTRFA